jgi:uncharacterized protein
MVESTDSRQETWRNTVRRVARDAADLETRARLEQETVLFNYRWEHVQAVVQLAVRLAELVGADREVAEAAAWLHDVAKGQSRDHGRDGAVAAERILRGTDFPQDKIEAVADAILKHVGLSREEPLEPIEAAVLWDADKLTKLGATAVLHFVGYEINAGQGTTEQLIDCLLWEDWSARIVRSLQTAPARAAGQRRLSLFCTFREQAAQELPGDDLNPLP